MLCVTYDNKEKLKIIEAPIPQIKEDEALLKVDVCGVCGSDLVKIKKNLISEGTVLGHEVVGTIVEVGSHVRKWTSSQKVVVAHHVPCLNCYFCKSGNFSMCEQFKNTNLYPGGFSEFIKLSRAHLEQTTFLIPKSTVSDYEIALTEPLACCLRAVKRANISTSNSVLICGLGSIGIMLGKLCIEKGAQTFGIDILQKRITLAKEMTAIHDGYLANSPELKSWMLNKTEGRGVDIILLASGSENSLPTAINCIRPGGTIIVFSSVPREQGFFNNEIYYRELTIIGSYSPSPIALKEAHQLIITGKIKLRNLITDIIKLKDLPSQIDKCFKNESLKMMIEN
ncbi:MAG: alcohol dehydrogenase catalytic domain-containing protein [Candidatus Melainabacteria bacterium]|nr:alcohol dehydrogenase catalytic domain-containing protein [Candidatus Melainabacteria bacterium]